MSAADRVQPLELHAHTPYYPIHRVCAEPTHSVHGVAQTMHTVGCVHRVQLGNERFSGSDGNALGVAGCAQSCGQRTHKARICANTHARASASGIGEAAMQAGTPCSTQCSTAPAAHEHELRIATKSSELFSVNRLRPQRGNVDQLRLPTKRPYSVERYRIGTDNLTVCNGGLA